MAMARSEVVRLAVVAVASAVAALTADYTVAHRVSDWVAALFG